MIRAMFKSVGREVAQGRMQSHGVVEVDDVVGNVFHGFSVIGVLALPDPLHLQVQKETLGDSVVPAIALPAHAGHQALLGQ